MDTTLPSFAWFLWARCEIVFSQVSEFRTGCRGTCCGGSRYAFVAARWGSALARAARLYRGPEQALPHDLTRTDRWHRLAVDCVSLRRSEIVFGEPHRRMRVVARSYARMASRYARRHGEQCVDRRVDRSGGCAKLHIPRSANFAQVSTERVWPVYRTRFEQNRRSGWRGERDPGRFRPFPERAASGTAWAELLAVTDGDDADRLLADHEIRCVLRSSVRDRARPRIQRTHNPSPTQLRRQPRQPTEPCT